MRNLFVLQASLFLALAVVGQGRRVPVDPILDDEWIAYKDQHGKAYESDEEEYERHRIWQENVDFIEKHNAEYKNGVHTFWLEVNEFADMTNAEFTKERNGLLPRKAPAPQPSRPIYSATPNDEVPTEWDWRPHGLVTPVKNQGQCGSCWAFSATGSLEGQHYKKQGVLVSLSEQNLVDCSAAEGNYGCSGGLPDNAFQYVIDNGGIDTEASYPYEATETGHCDFTSSGVGATITSFQDLPSGREDVLKSMTYTVGPISVGMDANGQGFQFYSGGIYASDSCSTTTLDHGVLVVGYGVNSTLGQDYWIVKNSWGAAWGAEGYFLLARNQNNMCGIATMASYPVV